MIADSERQDFNNEVKSVTLLRDRTRQDVPVCIEIFDDNINEANEGFLLVLTIDEERTSSEILQVFDGFIRGGTALALIMDDDSKYTYTNCICVFKEDI